MFNGKYFSSYAIMLKRNLAANYAGTAFVSLTQIVLIPLYLNILGEYEWGVLSAIIALSTALLILEAGLSLIVARSLSDHIGNSTTINHTFRRLEAGYLRGVFVVILAGTVAAPSLSQWMFAGHGHRIQIAYLAIVISAAQIMSSLYRSVFVGIGKQVPFNVLLIIFTMFRHSAALAAALNIGGAASVASAFAISFCIEATVRRWHALHALSVMAPRGDDRDRIPNLRSGSLPLVLATAVGALSTNLDRLTLSGIVTAIDLGRYAIAATLSLSTLQLIYPISTALIPKLHSFRDRVSGHKMMWNIYKTLLIFLAIVWIMVSAASGWALPFWLDDADAAAAVRPLFLMHMVGTSLNALSIPLYLRLLALHQDRRIAATAVVSFSVQLMTLALLLSLDYGTLAGSIAWCAGNLVLLLTYCFFELKGSEIRP